MPEENYTGAKAKGASQVKRVYWHSGPPNPLQCPPWHSGPTERQFSCPAQVWTIHGSPSNSVHDGIQRDGCSKPRHKVTAFTAIWGRGSLGLNSLPGQGEGDGGSDALSWSQAVPAAPSLHKHSALTYLPRITQGDCSHKEPCAQISSPGPFTSRTEGKQAGGSMLQWYQIINILDKYFDIKIGISALFLLPWQHHSPVRECTK